MTYAIHSIGYEQGPEFPTMAQAREALRGMLEDDKKKCRSRFGEAHVFRSPDSYSIHLAADRRSATYSAASIY